MTNPYEFDLRRARARHRRILAGIALVCVAALVVVAATIVPASGTAVRIAPSDAAATGSVRVIEGLAVAAGGVVYALGGEPRIAVGAEGFQTQEVTIPSARRGTGIDVTLIEKPATLVLTSDPSRAETRWRIDDRTPQIAERVEAALPSGGHVIEVNNPFFEKERLDLDLKRAESRAVTVPLRPVAGTLRIATTPPGAAVAVDGAPAGGSPVDIALPGGLHDVVVRLGGYMEITEQVQVRNDRPEVTRNYILQPETATLAFSVVHKGGVLLLDGKKVDPSHSRQVSANRQHTVTYALPGYVPETQVVTLAPGETRLLRFKLAPDLGAVDIRVDPPADIIIDGRKVAEGAARLELPSRPHVLLVRKPGYRSVKKILHPSGAHKTVVDITLETELEARLREAPRTYTNAVGIELTLFKPGSVVLGAPRHEKGQRANEVLRQVYLRKPFYAARYEVTESQFLEFRGRRGNAGKRPAVSVSWLDAAAFCNWLSLKEGLPPFYIIKDSAFRGVNPTAEGYRLLTEAEWEWLARRAGKPKQTMYTWGDESVVPRGAGNIADESANGLTRYYIPNYNDGYKDLAPVGSFPAEASGLFDQTGNAAEWVHDYYSVAPPSGEDVSVDPLGPETGAAHVVKGSSWRSGTRTTLRAAYRESLPNARDDVGFRIGRYLYGQNIIAEK